MADELRWFYMDSTGQEFGPYPSSTMKGWFQQGFFPMQGELQVRLEDMDPDTHYFIKDLYPSPITQRAFDGAPNLPSDGRGRGGRSRGGGPRNVAPAASVDIGASAYAAAGLDPFGMMGGMMPSAMQNAGMPPFSFAGMRPGMGMPGMGGMAGMMPGMPPMMGPGAATGRYQGRIKSFNVQKGFGFIECPEAHQVYGRDVFLHKAQIGQFQIGSQVSFAVDMNKSNMPQARDLLESDMLAGFGGGMMGMPGMGMGGSGGKGFNNSKGGAKGKGGAKKQAKAAAKKPAEKKASKKPSGPEVAAATEE